MSYDIDLDESVSNHDWCLLKIAEARTQDRLDWIAEVIRYAKWEDEAWTMEADKMAELTQCWKAKRDELRASSKAA